MPGFARHLKSTALIERALPTPLVQRLIAWRKRWVFARALRAFIRAPARAIAPGCLLLEDLVWGYGLANPTKTEYLGAVISSALSCTGPILQGGSGLSALLVREIAAQRQIPLFSTLQNIGWIQRNAKHLGSRSIHDEYLQLYPLDDYRAFQWSRPLSTVRTQRQRFSLVVCDGSAEPSSADRFSVLTMMAHLFDSKTTILLGDAQRASEMEVARHLSKAFKGRYVLRGRAQSFLEIRLRVR